MDRRDATGRNDQPRRAGRQQIRDRGVPGSAAPARLAWAGDLSGEPPPVRRREACPVGRHDSSRYPHDRRRAIAAGSECADITLAEKHPSRRLDAHVAVGHEVARAVERDAGLPRDSVRTIYNGVPDLGPAAARWVRPTVSSSAASPASTASKGSTSFCARRPASTTEDHRRGRRARGRSAARAGRRARARATFRIEPWSDTPRGLFDEIDVFALPLAPRGFRSRSSRRCSRAVQWSPPTSAISKRPSSTGQQASSFAGRCRRMRRRGAPQRRSRGTAPSARGRRVRALAHSRPTKWREFERLYDELADADRTRGVGAHCGAHGGTEKYVEDAARSLASRHDVVVVTGSRAALEGVGVARLPGFPTGARAR